MAPEQEEGVSGVLHVSLCLSTVLTLSLPSCPGEGFFLLPLLCPPDLIGHVDSGHVSENLLPSPFPAVSVLMVSSFCSAEAAGVTEAVRNHAPSRRCKAKVRGCPWFSAAPSILADAAVR